MPRAPSVDDAFAMPEAAVRDTATSSLIMGEHLARSVRGISCAPPARAPKLFRVFFRDGIGIQEY